MSLRTVSEDSGFLKKEDTMRRQSEARVSSHWLAILSSSLACSLVTLIHTRWWVLLLGSVGLLFIWFGEKGMEKFGHLLGLDGAITPADFVGIVNRLPRGAVLLEFADHRTPRGVSILVELSTKVVEVFVV